jgi:hypothetical protein
LIHQFEPSSWDLQIRQGTSNIVAAAATRVDSPRHNSALPQDANQDGNVTAGDALVIINDLARHSARILAPDEPSGFDVDVNNDGSATALDALLVINYLGRVSPVETESMLIDPSKALVSAINDPGMPRNDPGMPPASVDSALASMDFTRASGPQNGKMRGMVSIIPTSGPHVDLVGREDSDGRGGHVERVERQNDDTQRRPVTMDGGRQETYFSPGFTEKTAVTSSEIGHELDSNSGQSTATIRSIRAEILEPLDDSMV